MAVEIKKVYKEHLPAVRFIGKCYTDKDRVNGSFGAKWIVMKKYFMVMMSVFICSFAFSQNASIQNASIDATITIFN
jgi:hypothetical protein